MNIEECGELIQTEAEELAEVLLGVSYFDLCPKLQIWIRTQAVECLWPEYTQQESIPAA
jgi:hypothetical protein